MQVGIVVLAVGFSTIPLTANIPQLALAAAMIPIGTALLFPATTSLVSGRAPAGQTGQVLGVQQAFGGISRLVGPLWAGAVFQYVGIRAPFWLCALLMSLAWVLASSLRLEETASSTERVPGASAISESVEVVSREAPS